MKFLPFILIVLLSGCATGNNQLQHDPEHDLNKTTITFIPSNSVKRAFRTDNPNKNIIAVSQFKLGEPKCTIISRKPRSINDRDAFESLGHELWHCLKGRWHNQDNVKYSSDFKDLL